MGSRSATNNMVAGYFRVSMARDGMKAPELYEDEIRRYCRYKNLDLAKLYSDIDYSAFRGAKARPSLEELVADRKSYSAIIVPKLSRFGRSVKDLVALFEQFDRDGIALIFLDMNIDTSTSQGRLLRHIMAAFAEYESDVKADYARANYRHAMQQGRTWGLPPFGYRAENKRYFIVKPEAEIIRNIYGRYVDGASLSRIAIELNAAGLVGHKNGYWRTPQVGRVLDNPAYAGLTVLDENVFTAQWEPIVSRETWNQVQKLRLPENRGQRARKVGTGGPYLLTGLIVCGKCGGNAHHHRKSRGSAYQCMNQQHTEKCGGGGVSRDRADRIVTDAVVERVRFTFGSNAEFVSARDAWDKATLDDKRRVLKTVLDRVVIEPKNAGDAQTSPRRLTLVWKPQFSDVELVAAPLEEAQHRERRGVKEGRSQSHRDARERLAKRQRSKRVSTYFDEWRAFQAARIVNRKDSVAD